MLSSFLLLPIPRIVGAGVVVNELYYDPPGADAGREFVEFMNTGPEPAPLDGVVLEFHNGVGVGWVVVWRAPDGIALAPDALWVVGGAAVTPSPDAVLELALQNGPDSIRLVDARGGVLDLVGYGGLDDPVYVETRAVPAVASGQSIARTPDGVDTDDNASDFASAAPTPGRRNVARHDAAAALAPETRARAGRSGAGVERIALEVHNRGLLAIPAGAVAVAARDSSAHGVHDAAQADNRTSIAPGERERVVLDVSLAGTGHHWIRVRASYAPDERPANDALALVRRVGRPGVIVSEIFSAPRPNCPQFVELYNAGSETIQLGGYSLRDMRSRAVVLAADSLALAPRAFLVVTGDTSALRACTPGSSSARVMDVAGPWPAFNKTGSPVADSVVVLDALGVAADAVAYPGIVQAEYSLERVDLFLSASTAGAVWRASAQPGGSPGRAGAGALAAPPRASCEVSPNPFSPARGDLLRVAIAPAPEIARAVVRVYDASGRRVCDVGTASAFPAVLLWDGRGADGDLVRAGVYVLACETFAADGGRVGVEKVVVGCARRFP